MSVYTRSGYTLRRLGPGEWPMYKAIRLEALATDPSVFGNSIEIESTYPDEHWQHRLQAPDKAIWGLFFGEILVGLTGIFIHDSEPSEARLTHSFIRPAH